MEEFTKTCLQCHWYVEDIVSQYRTPAPRMRVPPKRQHQFTFNTKHMVRVELVLMHVYNFSCWSYGCSLVKAFSAVSPNIHNLSVMILIVIPRERKVSIFRNIKFVKTKFLHYVSYEKGKLTNVNDPFNHIHYPISHDFAPLEYRGVFSTLGELSEWVFVGSRKV